jgi:hypothetical protein
LWVRRWHGREAGLGTWVYEQRVCESEAATNGVRETVVRLARDNRYARSRVVGALVECLVLPRWRDRVPGPLRAAGTCRGPVQVLPHISHICSRACSIFYRCVTNNVEKHTHSRPSAKSRLLTGPGPTTEPPRYPRVAVVRRPALVSSCARLCRFPGRDAAFRAQRGLCRPDNDGVPLLERGHRRFATPTRSEIVVHDPMRPHSELLPLMRLDRREKSASSGVFSLPGAFQGWISAYGSRASSFRDAHTGGDRSA